MLRWIIVCMLIGGVGCAPRDVRGQATNQDDIGNGGAHFHEVWGQATNGLQPDLYFEKYGSEWVVDVEYFAPTSFDRNDWLLPTNRAKSKLELSRTNGAPVISKNPDVIAALHPPAQTTVSNILSGVRPASFRGNLWLRTFSGSSSPAGHFELGWAFGLSFTNDYILQITPFIYRPDARLETARLMEFAPVKVKLFSNGTVQKMNTGP